MRFSNFIAKYREKNFASSQLPVMRLRNTASGGLSGYII